MKKLIRISIISICIITIISLGINYVFYEPTTMNAFVASKIYKNGAANSSFDDDNFYKCVVDAYNNQNETSVPYTYNLSDEELLSITYLSCTNKGVRSSKGLEKLISLTHLNVYDNQLIGLDVSNNTKLRTLSADRNQLTELDVSNNTALTDLYLDNNQLIELDVSNNTALRFLNVIGNQLTEVDVSKNVVLIGLYLSDNQLTSLDVSKNVLLESLKADGNKLSFLNLDNNVGLKGLYVDNNQLRELDLSDLILLETLYVANNQLTELDVSQNILLEILWIQSNQLTSLDVSKNVALRTLYAWNNQLTKINVSQNVKLTGLRVENNNLTELDLSVNVDLNSLRVYNNQLTELDLSKNVVLKFLYANSNNLTELDLSNNIELVYLAAYKNQLTELNVSQNIALEELYIDNNPFEYSLYVYSGNSVQVFDTVKLPSHLNDLLIWSSKNSSIAMVDVNGKITTLKSGNVSVVGSSSKYKVTNKVNVVEITSDKYVIDEENDVIYVGEDVSSEVIKNNINKSHKEIDIELNLEDNKLLVRYKDEILKEFNLVSISSSTYDLSKDYIYLGEDEFDASKITVINGVLEVKENKLSIKYEDEELQIYDLVGIKLGSLNVSNNLITVEDNISYENFVSNIDVSDRVSYKIFKGNIEVTSGNMEKGMVLKFYFGEVMVDSYDITDEYLNIDQTLIVDENMYMFNLVVGNTVSDLLDKVDTSGKISVVNNKGVILDDDSLLGTGNKLKIELSSKTIEYSLVIVGDIDGDGKMMLSDIMKVAKYVYNDENKTSLTGEYLRAADFDGNGLYNIQDIMKLARSIYVS